MSEEAQQNQEFVPCHLCGQPTRMLGTKSCDRCWELESRIKRDLELAKQIIKALEEH